MSFINHQNTEGWDILLLGYIPTCLYDSLAIVPRLLRKNWVAKIIEALDNYHSIIWMARNELVHSSSVTATVDQTLESMRLSVFEWYHRQDELTHAGRGLLPSEQSTVLRLSKSSLAELLVQLNSFHALWTRAPRITPDIRQFFRPLT
jgi:hypothetical protein